MHPLLLAQFIQDTEDTNEFRATFVVSFERGQVQLPTGNVFRIEEYKELDAIMARINTMMICALQERDSFPESARPILFTGAAGEAIDLPYATCSLVPLPSRAFCNAYCQRAEAQRCSSGEVDEALNGALPTLAIQSLEILPDSRDALDDDDDGDGCGDGCDGSSHKPRPLRSPSFDGGGDDDETPTEPPDYAQEWFLPSPSRRARSRSRGRGQGEHGSSTSDARCGTLLTREEAALRLRIHRALLPAPDGRRR